MRSPVSCPRVIVIDAAIAPVIVRGRQGDEVAVEIGKRTSQHLAANELYIHRTSFMRRIAQIDRIAQVNLDDPDEVLHLLLSAKLMGL